MVNGAAMLIAKQRGVAYIGVLLLIALLEAALLATGQVWHTAVQRAKKADLVFIGGEFSRALASYYDSTPGQVKQYPQSLDELVLDRRYPVVRRYLRKIYMDPMTSKPEWGLVLVQGRIVGVHSLSADVPFKGRDAAGTQPGTYRNWVFKAEDGRPPAAALHSQSAIDASKQ